MDRKNQSPPSSSAQAGPSAWPSSATPTRIEDFRHMELAKLLEEFYTLQGKAERIKNFPLPRQYATANHWFVKIFIATRSLWR